MALANQQAAHELTCRRSGLSTRRFIPSRYPGNYNNCFHDMTTGNNRWSGSPNSV